ncbi:hypothetical protein A4S05_28855 [Nostoc sp. KVJ20]|uniref:hypothetical protein n=1 Tax=Nostoc sp. KVJ20 TaxID=457944 RepID=UPI00083D8CA3|nr:hypothetical protein [Nostoc sp. KVJ20]ODH01468.1 hypothetical protein A4S05_28855 [Nostoc sp. KVJ20]
MFDQIMNLLGRFFLSNIEQAQTVQSSPKPVNEELIIHKTEPENIADCQYEKQSSRTAITFLQQQLNTQQNNETLSLWPPNGEYQGPIIINHSLTLDGQGATIWSLIGPVLSIQSDRVILKNLRIEVTGCKDISSQQDACAILVNSSKNLEFHNVEVRGTTMGLPEEEGAWKFPNLLTLGKLAPRTKYNFLLQIVVPVACQIESQISGIELTPHYLTPGENEIQLHLEELLPSTYINGNLFIVSAFLKRRITLTAYVASVTNSELLLIQNRILWKPEECASRDISESKPEIQEVEAISLDTNNRDADKIEDEVSNNNITLDKECEGQLQKYLRGSKTRREVKPNNQVFQPVSNKVQNPLQQDTEIKKQPYDVLTTLNQNSQTEQIQSSQKQSSSESKSSIKSYIVPSPVFNPKPIPSESTENEL